MVPGADLMSEVSGCEMLDQLGEREGDAKQCNSYGNIDKFLRIVPPIPRGMPRLQWRLLLWVLI